MTVNISKHLLGIACIIAGALIPLILCMLTLLPTWFDPRGAARLIQFTVLVNLRESSEARGRGGTSLEQLPGTPPPC